MQVIELFSGSINLFLSDQFYTWTRWGRVGSPGQHALKEYNVYFNYSLNNYIVVYYFRITCM